MILGLIAACLRAIRSGCQTWWIRRNYSEKLLTALLRAARISQRAMPKPLRTGAGCSVALGFRYSSDLELSKSLFQSFEESKCGRQLDGVELWRSTYRAYSAGSRV